MLKQFLIAALLLELVPVSAMAKGKVRTVGPHGRYRNPCRAAFVASKGDIIEIDASGDYRGDVCLIRQSGLTLRGVNGRPKIDAAGKSAQGKATWVIAGDNTTVDNIEFTGSQVHDRNGAGIRQEGANLTVKNCFFHDNENGILAGTNLRSAIVVENSEFARNGFGDGYSHNIYIGKVASFTLRFSYFHQGRVGHLIKTRALENYILYNRITDETGNASYELDISNGGLSYVIGNLFQQSAVTSNDSIIGFAMEGPPSDGRSLALFVVNNTFYNQNATGIFVNVKPAVTTPAVIRNNIFAGPGVVTTQAKAVQAGNFVGDPGFVRVETHDYSLKPGSPAIGAGVNPGVGSDFSLTPEFEYVHPASSRPRPKADLLDAGALRFQARP